MTLFVFPILLNIKNIITYKSKAIISANLEHNYGSKERLNLDTDKYFNAGVLIIDYKNWIEQATSIIINTYV